MKLNCFCSGTIPIRFLSPEKTTTKSSEYLIRRPLKLLEWPIHFCWVLTYSINLFQSWDLHGRSLHKILLLSLHFRMCLKFTVPDITTSKQVKCRKKYTESLMHSDYVMTNSLQALGKASSLLYRSLLHCILLFLLRCPALSVVLLTCHCKKISSHICWGSL